MKEDNTVKVRLSSVIYIIIIVLLSVALYYFGFVNKANNDDNVAIKQDNLVVENTNKEVQLNNTKTTDNEKTSTTTEEVKKDTVKAQSYGQPLMVENAYLEDGYLYYTSTKEEKPKKIEGVSNLKALYIYNIGTGVNQVPFVVAQDGTVYRLNYQEKLVKYEELANYKVDKILSHEGEMYDVFTLQLLDGTTKIVEVKADETL